MCAACCPPADTGARSPRSFTSLPRTSAGPAHRALAFSSSARAASYRVQSVQQVAGSQATPASLATACNGGLNACCHDCNKQLMDVRLSHAVHGPTVES